MVDAAGKFLTSELVEVLVFISHTTGVLSTLASRLIKAIVAGRVIVTNNCTVRISQTYFYSNKILLSKITGEEFLHEQTSQNTTFIPLEY